MKHLIFVVPFILLLFSCDEHNKDLKIVHFPNSSIVMQSIEYADGKKNGAFKEFYRNGNLKALQRFVNDTLNDTSFYFHENGQRAYIQIYKNNIRTNCWQKYNKEGKLYWEACFKNDIIHGTTKQYSYRSLKLIEVQNYNEGVKDGKQELYYNNGKPKSVTYYKMGEVASGTKEWLESGNEINNDFIIHVHEQNEVLLKSQLSFIIRLDNPKADDKLYEEIIFPNQKDHPFLYPIKKSGDQFIITYDVPRGGFVMKDVVLKAIRTTAMGNTAVSSTTFVASANNY